MNDASALICVESLTKSYRGNSKRALDDVSLSVEEGECFGLIGPNGAGKTTLMSCLLGLVRPDSGKIRIAGVPPDDLAVREVSGFLPERPNFENWLTAYEFMTLHHMLAKRPPDRRKEEIEVALTLTELESSCWHRKIETFSRGMLQRLGLAQSVLGEPAILFLDEPGSGMDPPGNNLLRQLFLQFKAAGTTVVLNSHHLDEMERVCDRVAFMKDGRIQAIEKLDKSKNARHLLLVRWLSSSANAALEDPAGPWLEALARRHDSALIEDGEHWARFDVGSSIIASKIIQEMVQLGVPICAALPEFATLERLFQQPAPGEVRELHDTTKDD